MTSATYAAKKSEGSGSAIDRGGAVGSLRIGDPDDAYEREADRVADEIMAGGSLKHHWSISSISMAAPLQRKCSCVGASESAECEECKKEKEAGRVQRKETSGRPPLFAPPIVHDVLRSPGQSLPKATREFFESKFGRDLSSVKVHTDARASKSADAVHASAYTVGRSIVFGANHYQPETKPGRHLLAHELSHVIHQQPGRSSWVQRQQKASVEVDDGPKPNSVLQKAFDAADSKHWEEAAELANGLSPGQLQSYIDTLKLEDPAFVDQLHIGAINNRRVGPNSAVAKATSELHLSMHYKAELGQKHYQTAAEYLNGFSESDIRTRLAILNSDDIAHLHQGAVENKGVGPESAVAKTTDAILKERSQKGDAKALEATRVVPKLSPQEERQRCQHEGARGRKIFPLRMPRGMWRIDVAPITARREGETIVVSQPLNAVYGTQMFQREVRTLPLQTFLGGVRLGRDEVVGVRVYDDNEKIICLTGEEMLKVSEATDTALLLSVVQTVVDAATIMAPGAGAGVSRATSLAIGGAGILANEAVDVGQQASMVHYGLQDKIDWAGVAFDTIFQLVTLGFGGKLSDAAVEVVLGETKQFTRPVLKLAVEAVVSGGLNDLKVVARTLFDTLRGKKQEMTVEEFILQLAKEFASGVLMHAVMTTAQHEQTPGALRTEEETPVGSKAAADTHEGPPPAVKAASKKPAPAKARGGGEPALTDTAKAVNREEAVATAEAANNHEVVVTKKGVGRCSDSPCPVIHVEYAKELDARPDLQKWNESVQALRKTDPELAAAEGKKLVNALEGERAGTKLSSEAVAEQRRSALDTRIAQAESELNPARQATVDYQAQRKAEGKSLKGGPIKGIWNVKERIWALKRARAYPDRLILEQARIVGVQAPDGKITATTDIAGAGRIPDFVEMRGSKAVAGDLKSATEFKKSVAGGLTAPKQIEGEFRSGSKVGGQHDVEGKLLERAKEMNGKIVIEGTDLVSGKSQRIVVDPGNYASEVLTYEDVQPN